MLHVHPHDWPPNVWFACDPDSPWLRGNDRLHEKLMALGCRTRSTSRRRPAATRGRTTTPWRPAWCGSLSRAWRRSRGDSCRTGFHLSRRHTAMTDGDALYRAILEQPDDDAPRLVWADWLEEHGGPDRAAFVRLQCEWVATDPGDPRRDELWQRWLTLLEARGSGWRDELEPDARPAGYRRDPARLVRPDHRRGGRAVNALPRAGAGPVRRDRTGRVPRTTPPLAGTVRLPLPDRRRAPTGPVLPTRLTAWLGVADPVAPPGRAAPVAAAFDLSSSGILAALAGTDWPDLRELDLRVSRADPGGRTGRGTSCRTPRGSPNSSHSTSPAPGSAIAGSSAWSPAAGRWR